jgi:hypothetical protein
MIEGIYGDRKPFKKKKVVTMNVSYPMTPAINQKVSFIVYLFRILVIY